VGLFSRKTAAAPAAVATPVSATAQPGTVAGPGGSPEVVEVVERLPLGAGPFDSEDPYPEIRRADLGAVQLPVKPGLQVRMEIDRGTRKITGITIITGQSAMQVQAFAAPRSEGIWDEVRGEISQGLSASGGGQIDDVPGRFGRELVARIPGTAPDGSPSVRAARFIGFDGPRWFLRGVLTGKAATDPNAAQELEDIFANIVVVRDGSPRPPRDLLTMTLPGQAGSGPAPVGVAGMPTEQEAQSFDPMKRGPEITEIH